MSPRVYVLFTSEYPVHGKLEKIREGDLKSPHLGEMGTLGFNGPGGKQGPLWDLVLPLHREAM